MEYKVYLTTKVTPKKIGKAAEPAILVIEPEDYSKNEVAALKATGHKVLGYLSIGSVSDERSYWKTISKYALDELEDWPHERYLDLRRAAARDFIIKRAEKIIKQGFDGLWLDNLDVYEEYKSTAMYGAITVVLKKIRELGGFVMVNGGYAYLQKLMDNSTDKAPFKVRIGAYSDRSRAEKRKAEAKEKGFSTEILEVDTEKGKLYKVQVDAFENRWNAVRLLDKLKAKGFQDSAIIEERAAGTLPIDGVTQEEVFSLITDYDKKNEKTGEKGVFSTQKTKQSERYQEHLKRLALFGVLCFLLEYTRSNTVRLRIRAFCDAYNMSACISRDVDL